MTLKKFLPFFLALLAFIGGRKPARWDHTLYDQLQRSFPPRLAFADPVLVAINDNSLKLLEETLKTAFWPWPRWATAELLQTCALAEAKMVFIDILLIEPREGDPLLKEAMGKIPTYLAADASLRKAFPGSFKDCPFPQKTIPCNPPPLYTYLLLPCLFQKEAQGFGCIHMENDKDGVLRRYRWVYPTPSGCLPSPAVLLSTKQPKKTYGYLRFYGSPGTFDTVDAYKLFVAKELYETEGLIPEVEKVFQRLRHHRIILGVTATGGYDLRSTPVSPIYPGMEIHATALANLEQGDLLRVLPPGLQVILWWGLFFLVSTGPSHRPKYLVLQGILVFLSFLGFTLLLFFLHFLIPWSFPFALALLLWAGRVGNHYFHAWQERQQAVQSLRRVLNPEVVRELMQQGKLPEPGGELREITVFFSDMRNFTTLSEKVDPSLLVQWLNEYFEIIVTILFKYQGTLDKFIGDAVMAFWGAPLIQKNQGDLALQAAQEILKKLKSWNEKREKEGLPRMDTGIGIASGPSLVGFVGPPTNLNYTAIGDVVNTASRIEGMTKQYPFACLVSETTVEILQGDYCLKKVDRVMLKGKTHPITLFGLEV